MLSSLIALAVVVLGVATTLSAPLEQLQENQRPETREEQIQPGLFHKPRNERTVSDEDLRLCVRPKAFHSSSGLKTTGEYDDATKELMATPRSGVVDGNEVSGRRKRMPCGPSTGEYDDATKELMATPRCGVVDGNEVSGRRKRFTVYGESNRWPMSALTYRILNYTPDLPTVQTKQIIAQAFKYWSDASLLTFTELNGTENANIKLSFVPRDHGDGRPFDGPDGVVAHAYPYPIGEVHFEVDEQWSGNSTSGKSLLWVAVHEIGHALGLNHSALNSAVMYSHFEGRTVNTLDPDDIAGIQSLYGMPMSRGENSLPLSI